jgi:hypothetical protein
VAVHESFESPSFTLHDPTNGISHKNLCFLCRDEIALHNYQVALIYFLNVIGLKKCAKLDRDCFQFIIELSCYRK